MANAKTGIAIADRFDYLFNEIRYRFFKSISDQ
jgi:hypothetical protein